MDSKIIILARIFSIAFAIALAKALYDGGFHYYAMGSEKGFSAQAQPVKFYLAIIWYFTVFIVATYVGFIHRRHS